MNSLSTNVHVPDWMMAETELGTDTLKMYVKPPRLRVVQPLSKPPLSDMFNPGDVIAMPMLTRVAPILLTENGRPSDRGEVFHIVPIFMFMEWVAWNPQELAGTLPAVRERSFDPRSDLAIKSRSPETWEYKCPERPELNVRINETYNFIILALPPNVIAGTPSVLSFSRAEHRAGSNFCSLIGMRRAPRELKQMPIYGCQFEACVHKRTNQKGAWYGIDLANPDPKSGVTPFVQDQELYIQYRALHLEFAKAHAERTLVVDYDADEATVREEKSDEEPKF